MSSDLVKTLISVVFLVLFAVEFIWLVKERKCYKRLAILEAGSLLLAVVLTFVFDHFQGDEYEARSPWLYPWVLCQMMAIIFAARMETSSGMFMMFSCRRTRDTISCSSSLRPMISVAWMIS